MIKSPRRAAADAPAKINLTLEVLGRRADGFHELRSLAIGVDLRDRVECSIVSRPGITIDCDDRTLATEDNLVVRAAHALASRSGRNPKLAIRLEKRTPAGAGLGGGSSDAATTLRLCNHLWNAGLGDGVLATIGAEIGSDVPLFFALPAAVITGRGKIVEPVRMSWRGWVLLVLPELHVSTADVYRSWRPEDSADLPRGTEQDVLRATTASEITRHLTNHLEPAVFQVCPAVAGLKEQLSEMGLDPLRVSGSGSALYRLFDNPEEARRAAKTIKRRLPHLRTEVASAPAGEDPIVSEE